MPPSRRNILKIAGSTAVIAAAGGAGIAGFAATRTPTEALKPWSSAGGGYDDPRLRALSYAILAPNPHNRQPWLVQLVDDNGILLHCDPDRLLPDTDPFNRQIVIGLGCFLELLTLAAAADGYAAAIRPFPAGMPEDHLDGRPVARVVLRRAGTVAADPLFAQVFQRRSNKEPYDTARTVPASVLRALESATARGIAVGTSNDPARVADFRALSWRAHQIEVTTPRTYMESVRLMRIGKAEIEASPDGIDIGGAFPDAMRALGVLTRHTLADPNSVAFEQGLEMYRAITGSGMAYLWLISRGNGRLHQLSAGRAWLRVNLKAAELGVGIHPLSQALQEYPEMSAVFTEIHGRLGAGDGQRVQMFARLGYGPALPPSPRWPLASRVRNA